MRLACFLMLIPFAAHAETAYITIPGEGWSLRVDAPALTSSQSKSSDRRFRYMASSVETGVTLSVHVETEGGGSNGECRDTFWPRAQRNPHLVKGSEQLFENAVASFATHRSEGVYQGKPFKTANAHAYIAKNGLCIDVHVSHWPYADHSEKLIKGILDSITIVE